jgi:major vault protein
VIDNNTGVVRLVEGPHRGSLESNEAIYGKIQEKIIVKEGQFAVINNPFNATKKDIVHGDREIRPGPAIFSLYPGEYLEGGQIYNEYVLAQDTGLLIQATRNFDDSGKPRKAGDRWIIEGPTHYIPHKYATVEKVVNAISLAKDQGMYIKNIRSGEIRLERGPKSFLLSPQEEPFEKDYTARELAALKLEAGAFDASQAQPLNLLKSEACMIITGVSHRVEFGPKVILLEPFEHPYIMSISGSTPKKPHFLKIWNVLLGPEFSSDELSVRTKDNAVLIVRLRYKWRFQINPEHPEKLFAVEDFIGYATETMAGIIREEAAKHNFEEFHSSAAEIVKKAIFGEKDHYIFEENGFEIFGIDIKRVVPEDAEIAAQLNKAIKSNMEVYVNKIQQTAQLEAERQLVAGKTEIERSRAQLITSEQENLRTQKFGAAKIDAETIVTLAQAEAQAIQIKKNAEATAEAEKIAKIASAIKQEGGESYIRLQQVASFGNVEKTLIVPSDSKLWIPFSDVTKPNPSHTDHE